jgi:hypothetical protein
VASLVHYFRQRSQAHRAIEAPVHTEVEAARCLARTFRREDTAGQGAWAEDIYLNMKAGPLSEVTSPEARAAVLEELGAIGLPGRIYDTGTGGTTEAFIFSDYVERSRAAQTIFDRLYTTLSGSDFEALTNLLREASKLDETALRLAFKEMVEASLRPDQQEAIRGLLDELADAGLGRRLLGELAHYEEQGVYAIREENRTLLCGLPLRSRSLVLQALKVAQQIPKDLQGQILESLARCEASAKHYRPYFALTRAEFQKAFSESSSLPTQPVFEVTEQNAAQ